MISLPRAHSVTGYFPGAGSVVWRDFFTHEPLSNPTQLQTLAVPMGKIGLHIRSGTALALYEEPGYTIASTRRSDIRLLVSLSPGTDGAAQGKVYFDDGESLPPTPYREIEIFAEGGRDGGKIWFAGEGTYMPQSKLQTVVVLANGGENSGITEVRVGDEIWKWWQWDEKLGKLVIESVGIDLNGLTVDTISWR